ncbi:unnamed protein product [Rangifer tarandus platyrhynchus]|uniref:Uncharacterized protein n=2 Tax=Rangifer tarandus platyrhynchus TaxID=3082113 RepID=A0ABN8YUY9_RANTA|nr:unnamed protein product [Rangifer tarandus platyrhynchus]CAI9702895.1 unnamed protein product [Rangifer tarandus platyrhynchus]
MVREEEAASSDFSYCSGGGARGGGGDRICSHAPAPSQLPGGSGEGPSHPRPSRPRFPPPPSYRCSAFPGLSPPTPDPPQHLSADLNP